MTKNILFDLSVCQPNMESKFHGGGVYGYIVFKELAKLYSKQIVAYFDFDRFIDPSVLEIIAQFDVLMINAKEYSLREAYKISGAEKIYSPLYSMSYDKIISDGIPFIITMHGLRALEMFSDKDEVNYAIDIKQWIKAKIKMSLLGHIVWQKYYKQYEKLFFMANVCLITVSQHSKYSIKNYYPKVDIDKILVFYSPSTTVDKYERFVYSPKEKYYLIISANRWLKNAGRAILALDKIFDTNPNICGRVKVLGLKHDTNIYRRIKHKEKFELLGYQNQEELEYLYAGAYAFIYPTLNEGFGYPPLEAMKYGVPVIASAFSSIPEVCGDAVLYTNPYSVDEISNRILQLENRKIYEFYKSKSLERFKYIHKAQIKDLEGLLQFIINWHVR